MRCDCRRRFSHVRSSVYAELSVNDQVMVEALGDLNDSGQSAPRNNIYGYTYTHFSGLLLFSTNNFSQILSSFSFFFFSQKQNKLFSSSFFFYFYSPNQFIRYSINLIRNRVIVKNRMGIETKKKCLLLFDVLGHVHLIFFAQLIEFMLKKFPVNKISINRTYNEKIS